MQKVNVARALARAGFDVAMKNGPKAVLEAVKFYNRLILRGEISRARAAIKVEFLKNRQVAVIFFEKYKAELSEEVQAIFREMMTDGGAT